MATPQSVADKLARALVEAQALAAPIPEPPPPPPPPPPATLDQITPALDANGVLPDSWWAGISKDRWVEVMGTDMMTKVAPLLPPGFVDHGVEKLEGLFHDWAGAAIDRATGLMWFSGGGHLASSNNAIPEFALEKMAWRMAMPPTIITAADVQYSKNSWNTRGGTIPYTNGIWQTYSQGYDYPNYFNKDGKQTANHSYASITWAEDLQRILINHRQNYWRIDPASGGFEKKVAKNTPSGNATVYDPVTHKAYTFYSDENEWFSYRIYDLAADTLSTMRSLPFSAPDASPIIIGRELFLFQDAYVRDPAPKARRINLDTGVGQAVTLTGHPARAWDGSKYKVHTWESSGDYCAATGKCYYPRRRDTAGTAGYGPFGGFTTVDPRTGECGLYVPAGTPPPVANANWSMSPYTKFRIYQRPNGMAFMVWWQVAQHNLRLVRLA